MKTSPNRYSPFVGTAVAESLWAFPAVPMCRSYCLKACFRGFVCFLLLTFVCKSAVFFLKKSLCNSGRVEQNFLTSRNLFPDVKKKISARQEISLRTSAIFCRYKCLFTRRFANDFLVFSATFGGDSRKKRVI